MLVVRALASPGYSQREKIGKEENGVCGLLKLLPLQADDDLRFGIGTAPGQAITVMASQSDGYAEGALMRGHIPQKGDLVFRTYCRRFILTNRSNRVILISTTRGGSSLEVSF